MRTGIDRNALALTNQAAYVGRSKAIWIDQRSDSYTENGSFWYPYKTIPPAVSSLGSGVNSLMLMPGSYDLGGTGITIPAAGFSLIGFDVNNTTITSSVDTLSGTSVTGNILFQDITLATSGAYSAIKINGISATKNLTLARVILSAPATGYGGWFKDLPNSAGSYVNAVLGGSIGRLYFENASPILHGMNAQIIGATNAFEIKNTNGGFINDMAIIGTQAKSLVVDNSGGIIIRSVEAQAPPGYSGSNNLIELINNSTIQASDLSTTYNGSGKALYVESGSTIQWITVEGDRADFDIQGTKDLKIYDDDIKNSSAISGTAVKDALDNVSEAQNLKAIVTLVGATPNQSDFSSWSVGNYGHGVGTDSSIWWVYKDGASSIKSYQLT
ncbi:MAG: hypothetical protein GWM98_04650 [Nitrospinaceae bacterium]|nr:hypothetical protein [Deltaproteobacteria bacterium]NIY14209.1 hypothetical protein [Nitrospinaceae bacterium]